MSALYDTIGKSEPTVLLARPGGELIAVGLKPEQGVLTAGTVIYRGADGTYEAADAEKAVTTEYLAVLGETVDTSANTSIAEDAKAYISGCFVNGVVALKDSAEVTAEVKVVLRKQGITFRPDDEEPSA